MDLPANFPLPPSDHRLQLPRLFRPRRSTQDRCNPRTTKDIDDVITYIRTFAK